MNPVPVLLVLLRRYPFPILTLMWLGTRAFALAIAVPNGDIQLYFRVASHVVAGEVPYAQFPLEYPPGSLLLFVPPRLFTSELGTYARLFSVEMLLLELACLVLVWRLVPREDAPLAVFFYLVFAALLGDVVTTRFDMAVGFLAVVLVEAVRRRAWWQADLALALGIWIKLVPAVFLPLYLVFSFLETRSVASALRRCGALAAWLLGLFLPFALWCGPSLSSFLGYHAQRGVQVESTPGLLLLLASVLGVTPLGVTFEYGAWQVSGPVPSWVPPVSTLSVLAAGAWFSWRVLRLANPSFELWTTALLATLLFAMGLTKVFSPQYLTWALPLWALCLSRPGAHPLWILVVTGAAFVVTSVVITFGYTALVNRDPATVAVMLLRNLGVLAVAAWLFHQVFTSLADKPVANRAA